MKDSGRDSWVYPLSVTIKANTNYREFYNGLIKLLKSISIDENTATFRKDSGFYVGKLLLITQKKRSKRKHILPRQYSFRNERTIAFLEGNYNNYNSGDNCAIDGRIELNYFSNMRYNPLAKYGSNIALDRIGLTCFVLDKMTDFDLYYKTPQKIVQLYDLDFSQESIIKSKKNNNLLDANVIDLGSIPSRIFLYKNVTYHTYKIFSPNKFKNVTGFEIRPKY